MGCQDGATDRAGLYHYAHEVQAMCSPCVCMYMYIYTMCKNIYTMCKKTTWLRSTAYIVHPESFRSNTQIAIAFERRNRPRVNHNDEFACVYLRLRAFASTVRD